MVIGLVLLLFFFIWLFHLRFYSEYDPHENDTETDLLPSRTFWEKMAKWDKLEHGILAVLCLLFGIASIYNDLANYFGWTRLF